MVTLHELQRATIGTPIETADANTRAVFGDYPDTYPMPQAVEDGATVPIYGQNRLIPLALNDTARDAIDREFDEIVGTSEFEERETIKTKWAALEKIVGSDPRVARIAGDVVDHFEARLEALKGKARGRRWSITVP